MNVAHRAHTVNSAPPPVPPGEGIGEGMTASGEGFTSSGQPVGPHSEGISERLATISERLAVVAVAAHIMQRRAPHDCYARSIARETHALALAVRELHRAASSGAPMRAPRIVDASPSPDVSPPDATPASPSSTPDASPTPRARRARSASTRGAQHV